MRSVIKILLGGLLFLFVLAITAVGLLYVPPVQDFLCRQVTDMASDETGLHIEVKRLGLRFPLKLRVRDILATDSTVTDTLLYAQRLDVGLQLLPLLHGRIEVDGIMLEDMRINSAEQLPGMRIEGRLGRFFAAAHGIDLKKKYARLDRIELDGTQVMLALADTAQSAASDTIQSFPEWRIDVGQLNLREIEADVQLLLDTTSLQAQIETLCVNEAHADLGRVCYGWKGAQAEVSRLAYDQGVRATIKGVDPQHIVLRNINMSLDSVYLGDSCLQAQLANLSFTERSGLEVTSLTGCLYADTTGLWMNGLQMRTPYSEINLQGRAQPGIIPDLHKGCMDVRLNAYIGKQDLMILGGELPETFRRDYPPHALRIGLQAIGNLKQMELTHLETILPGAFELKGSGEMTDLTDGLNRKAHVGLNILTGKLDFLQALVANGGTEVGFAIPDSMSLATEMDMRGNELTAKLEMEEGGGKLMTHANYHLDTEAYRIAIATDSLKLHHFFPADSLYELMLHADIKGQGTDLASPRTQLYAGLTLDALHYGHSRLKDIKLTAQVNDSIGLSFTAGDLHLCFRSRGTVDNFLRRLERTTTLLQQQIEERVLNHTDLRHALPTAQMDIHAGKENPLSNYLRQKGIQFDQFRFNFDLTPEKGINGRTYIRKLCSDSLQIDTVFLAVCQNSSLIRLQGGIINGADNPQFVFRSILTGEIRNEDAELTLRYVDGEGNTGILLGMNARPLTEGHGRGNGLLLNLIPEQPVIAYRRFDFADRSNWIYLHRNMHVYAGVDMCSDDGIRVRLMSDPTDTVSLQNMRVNLTRFHLSELSRVMPYLPSLTGLLSIEGQYIQTQKNLQITGKANVQDLTYEKRRIGDVSVGLSWLPREGGTHYLGSTLALDEQKVMEVKGMLDTDAKADIPVDIQADICHLPLRVANAFVSDDMVKLAGRANGTFHLTGTTEKPQIAGSLTLDSASVYVGMLGARYWLDNRPVVIENTRLKLDKFSIYTTSSNPFIIDGSINLDMLTGPVADLSLQANDYVLLNAKRTRESIVYGKVVADVNATVKGPANALVFRGDMHLLGSTDLTYVLTDSPLTVDDRLTGLVTFVSFSDTTSTLHAKAVAPPTGGIDMLMTVRIDDAVRLRADLSPDRSKYIELEGGGELSLRYTPQGDMSLTGQYTLSDGVLKYSLPIIPLKELRISRGSYVDWRGDMMNPTLALTATEQTRASVAEGDDGQRMVDFNVSIGIRGKLSAPELIFDISAPHDATVQNELLAMGPDERSKQAIAMLGTGIYLNSGVKGGGLDMGAALNSVLQSQINSLAGQVKGASISVGVEDRTSAETGDKQTDYSFRYAQRFFGDRVQIVIGGKVSTGAGATNSVESFIDNISIEYRLDASGTRYVRAFYNKNYESVLDGEITETGIGLVLRRKVDRLSELFIFRKKEEE